MMHSHPLEISRRTLIPWRFHDALYFLRFITVSFEKRFYRCLMLTARWIS